MKHSKTYAAALSHPAEDNLEQEPESISQDRGGADWERGNISVVAGGDNSIDAPESIDEEFELYETTGFVSAAIHQYADDVLLPGVRIRADADDTETWLNETFLPQAGIVGGQRHQKFSQFLYQDVIQYLAGGNILDENVKDSEGQITGFLHINPATCKALTEPDKPILRSPDATEDEWWGEGTGDWFETTRGEAAAFAQYHDDSALGLKGEFGERDEIPLSLNDVTYRPRTPPAGEIWGIPITRNIKGELTEFKNIRRDLARAIRTKAWGIWSVAFDTEVIETKDEVLVEGWSQDEMDAFTEGVGSMDPGEIVGHDGTIGFEKHQGEVPSEVLDVLEAYVKMIVAALPPPLYAVGFEDNINQFVVREQEAIYESSVRSMQTTLTETWTPTLKQVCRDHDKDPAGVTLKLEPPEDESPIRSMELDDLEKFALYADGLRNMFGRGAYRAFKPEAFANLVGQLPADALKQEAFVGVPGGVPQDVDKLPYLEEASENGAITMTGLDALRQRIDNMRLPDDPPTSNYVNPFSEVTGGGGDGFFGAGEDDDDEQEAERSADGTFMGSN